MELSIGMNAAFKSNCFNLTVECLSLGLLLPDEYFNDRSLSRSRSLSLSFSRSRPDDDDEYDFDRSLDTELRLDFEFGEFVADFSADMLGLPDPVALACFGDVVL